FIAISCGWSGESGLGVSNQSAQPDVAEIHEFSILDIPEIWGISQNGVELLSVQVVLRGICATQGNRTLFDGARSITLFTNPFVFYKNLLLPEAVMADFERLNAV